MPEGSLFAASVECWTLAQDLCRSPAQKYRKCQQIQVRNLLLIPTWHQRIPSSASASPQFSTGL